MKKNKLVCLALVLVMIVSLLAACGSDSSSSSTASSSAGGGSSVVDQGGANTDDDVAEPVTLSMMVTTRPETDGEDFYLDVLPRMVNEKYPNITIEVEQLPTDQYKQTIRLKFASGQGPDLFNWWPGLQAQDLVAAGYVKDLSDFATLDKYNQDIVNSYTYDGKVYAIPNGTSFLTTWYNKDAFEDAGIEALPQNWDEFIECCEKLTAAGYTPITAGDKQSFVIQFGTYQIAASSVYGGNYEFDDQLFTGETKFTDEGWVDVITKFAELYEKGYVIDNSLGLSQDQSRQAFIDGDAAMIFDGSFGYTSLMNEGATSFERGMFCMPGNDAGGDFLYNLTPSTGLFVNAAASSDEAVEKVMNYWLTEGTELWDAWMDMNGDISCYEGAQDSREMINEYLERYSGVKSVYNCNNAWPEGVSDVLCSKFQEVISGTATPEDVAAAMQDKFDELSG